MQSIAEVVSKAHLSLVNTPESKSEQQTQPKIEPVERTPEEIAEDIFGAGVPKKFARAMRKDIHPKIWEMVSDFSKGQSYYIQGPVGSGKTHLAAAMVNHDIKLHPRYLRVNGKLQGSRRQYPFFIPATSLLLQIKDTFDGKSGESESELIDRYANCRCLVIDDIGVEKSGDWVRQTFYEIINTRYSEELQTVITSNLAIDQLGNLHGDRIASRLAEMCEIIMLTGKDRRLS